MPEANITSVTVAFGNGVKREEYGPVKKAEVSITASVSDQEDGSVVLAHIGQMALAKVAEMLSAPKPQIGVILSGPPEGDFVSKLNTVAEQVAQEAAAAAGEPPARRTRGPNKPKEEPKAQEPETKSEPAAEPAEDEWSAGQDDIVVSDQELLSATSKRAGELGAREPIVKLIATFATRTEGAPFKVQEIPQAQRKDYLDKLAALTA